MDLLGNGWLTHLSVFTSPAVAISSVDWAITPRELIAISRKSIEAARIMI
jgi:hypothetical protein